MHHKDDPARIEIEVVDDDETDVELFQRLLGAFVIELSPRQTSNATRSLRDTPARDN
jgi:hypothetical protein